MRQDLETSGVTIDYTVISWDWGYLSIPSPIPSSIPSPSHSRLTIVVRAMTLI